MSKDTDLSARDDAAKPLEASVIPLSSPPTLAFSSAKKFGASKAFPCKSLAKKQHLVENRAATVPTTKPASRSTREFYHESTYRDPSVTFNFSLRQFNQKASFTMVSLKEVKKVEDGSDAVIKPSSYTPPIDLSDQPLLLKDYDKMVIRTNHFTPLPQFGASPHARDIKSYVSSGVINLDKPSNPSSHEVVAWLKRILRYVLATLRSQQWDG